jgi:hypothetical protein
LLFFFVIRSYVLPYLVAFDIYRDALMCSACTSAHGTGRWDGGFTKGRLTGLQEQTSARDLHKPVLRKSIEFN